MKHGAGLLDQALSYAVDAVGDVTPALLAHPTPCRGWSLDTLLRHAYESLATIQEGLATGQVGRAADSLSHDPARAFADRAGRLLAAKAFGCRDVEVADVAVPAITVQCVGALEVAIHGWDISQACGRCRPIPETLAFGLLAVAPLLIPGAGRRGLFNPPPLYQTRVRYRRLTAKPSTPVAVGGVGVFAGSG
jgi:uncharacterized protein (TIGR03086 family)